MDIIDVVLTASPPKVKPGTTIFQNLQVLIDADELPDIEEKRSPLNVSLVIDRSGSMSGDAMQHARNASVEFINRLSEKDIISVVAYDDKINTLIKPTTIKKNKSKVIDAIRQLEARGSTDLHSGLVRGLTEVEKNLHNDFTNRVILLSDGQANVGITEINDINLDLKKRIKNKQISVSALGMGAYFNEILLEGLAEEFRGNYYYIEENDFIPRLISRELTGLLSLLWKNLEISFVSSGIIELKEILGYTVKGNTSFVGEVRSLDELYVICKYPIPSDLSEGEKITVTLRYDDLINKTNNLERVMEYPIEFSSDDAELKDDIAIIVNLELFALGNDIET
ncbi:MAG: vWA domain-containing protein, partial [Candidatus Hodarchaeales archaeon]